MDLRQLRYFVTIADEGSFTAAADRLGVRQSAASAAVRRLEQTLGSELFERTSHTLALTGAGQALLPQARRTLEASEDARAAVEAVAGGLSGTVRMGTVEYTNGLDVQAALRSFRSRHPRVGVALTHVGDGATQLVYDVRDGRLDLALGGLVGDPPPGVHTIVLWESPLRLAVAPDHVAASATAPLHLGDLAGETAIAYDAGGPNAGASNARLDEAGLEVAYQLNWLPSALAMVRDGAGVMLAAATATHWHRDTLVSLPLADAPAVKLVLAQPANRRPSVAARALAETLLAAYRPTDASVTAAS
jgi:DNA-binding transcriptional LysR family regulator